MNKNHRAKNRLNSAAPGINVHSRSSNILAIWGSRHVHFFDLFSITGHSHQCLLIPERAPAHGAAEQEHLIMKLALVKNLSQTHMTIYHEGWAR